MEHAASAPRSAVVAPDLPPGPRAPAIVQGLRYARDPLRFFTRLHRRFGNVFSLSFPYFGRIVYVADPGIVKRVFTGDAALFHAGEANATVLEPTLGPGSVLTLDEAEHLRQRKLLLPPFHGERVTGYGDLIREITERDVESWPLGEPFALRPHTQRITLAVILRAVFGIRDDERFARAAVLVGQFARRADLITQAPWLRRNLGRFSPWSRFQRARAGLDEFIYEEIAARRAEPSGAEHDDVLSLLLEARHDDGRPMSDEELRDELVTVVGAGHETTATALAWAVERILRTPRVLARLRASVEAGEDDYLDATIKETLRARPVIVDVARKLTAPAEIGGYELSPGTFVLPAIAALHYREDLYPEPHEFRPERFLDGKVDNYAWIPFGGGVRRCVGAAFAQYEMRVILRTLLERAELSAPDPRPERVKIRNVTLAPGKGCRVVLERRLPG
ncbi:MAG TPA: cytochrome P450 [Solirubrobacterales bacterium]|nr:cytochrome P450 [Solirubrobacterales bacterium]